MFNPFEELSAQLTEIKNLLTNPATSNFPQVLEQPVTAEELCKFLRISEPSLVRLKKKRKIPFIEVGGSIRYDKAAVVKALEKKEVT